MPKYYLSAYGKTSDGRTRRQVGNMDGYSTIRDARSAGYRILQPYLTKGKGRPHGIFIYTNKEDMMAFGFPVGELSIDQPAKDAGFVSYTLIHEDGTECVHRLNRDGTLDPEILHIYRPIGAYY